MRGLILPSARIRLSHDLPFYCIGSAASTKVMCSLCNDVTSFSFVVDCNDVTSFSFVVEISKGFR